jgi:hypothetical protein
MAERQQRFVYLLRSEKDHRQYVGMTCDVRQRLATHNSGGSLYTAPCRPWRLVVNLQFARQLASDSEGLARVALEALAAEGVRSGKLSAFQARALLGIQSRNEMDGFLKSRGVFLDLTLEDVQKDTDAALASSR